jgi:hypothetical protein
MSLDESLEGLLLVQPSDENSPFQPGTDRKIKRREHISVLVWVNKFRNGILATPALGK